MNYKKTLEFIESLKCYGIVPGLDSIKRLCEKMDNPQKGLKFVHVAGTNGKGSVIAYLSTILHCAGYKTGRYISPAVFEYREKYQVNQKNISQKSLCEGMEIIKKMCDEIVGEGFPHPTQFEVETVLAFWYFQEQKCDIVVLETGMGGLTDATNVIDTTITSVITSISMDHMAFLGKTLNEIAAQKAGIIKPHIPVVALRGEAEVFSVIEKKAKELGCVLYAAEPEKLKNIKYGFNKQSFSYEEYKNLVITIPGVCQIENAMLAVVAAGTINDMGYFIGEKALREGLKKASWIGRLTAINKKPLFLIDGAHNEDAAEKLAKSIEIYFTNKRIIYIMGVLRDKDYEKIISLTHKYADHIVTVAAPGNPRALPACELAEEIAKVHPRVTAADSIEEAVEMSMLLAGGEDVILAFGSLSYLGKITNVVKNIGKKK